MTKNSKTMNAVKVNNGSVWEDYSKRKRTPERSVYIGRKAKRIGSDGKPTGDSFVIRGTDWSKDKRLMVIPLTPEIEEQEKRLEANATYIGTMRVYTASDWALITEARIADEIDANEVILMDEAEAE